MPQYSTSDPQLIEALREIEESHYLIILADRKKALLFLFNNGEVVKFHEMMHPGVSKKIRTDSGELSGRNDKLMRHRDKQINDHFGLISQEAVAFIEHDAVNGVFIGGHKASFHHIIEKLPQELKKKLKTEFVTELNLPHDQLVVRCKEALDQYVKSILG